MAKVIFVNLPVTGLPRAKTFHEAMDFVSNAQFSDDSSQCDAADARQMAQLDQPPDSACNHERSHPVDLLR